jgi:hypothetical protein
MYPEEEYQSDEPAEYRSEQVEESVENDEMDPTEAAFLEGYEQDEEDSFDEKDDEED